MVQPSEEQFKDFMNNVAAARFEPVTAFLKQYPAAVNGKHPFWQETPLMYCAHHQPMVEFLLARGADPDLQNDRGDTIIHMSVAAERYQILRLLLTQATPDVDIRNHNGLTAMQLTEISTFNRGTGRALAGILQAETSRLREARDIKKNPNAEEVVDFCKATGSGSVAEMSAFLDIYPDAIDAKWVVNGVDYNALIIAVSNGNDEKTRLLLDRGANPNVQDYTKKTALHHAVNCKKMNTLALLLDEPKTNVRVWDSSNLTAEAWAHQTLTGKDLGVAVNLFHRRAQEEEQRELYAGIRQPLKAVSRLALKPRTPR